MVMLLDRLLLLALCFSLSIFGAAGALQVILLLIAVILSASVGFLSNRRICCAIFALYVVLSIFLPELGLYLPLIVYDVFLLCPPYIAIAGVAPLVLVYTHVPTPIFVVILVCVGLCGILCARGSKMQRLHQEFKELRDTSKELAMLMETKNKQLMEKQDYEIRLATLAERNRIAREIHDNVGHMLSRSLLQIGAMLALERDQEKRQDLLVVKQTLSQAMDSIRSSVHDLHDESIDLHAQLYALVQDFQFCPVRLDDGIESNLDKNIKYCFITIVKEALSNVMRHSEATRVDIILREHPALYQLIIEDNGRGAKMMGEGLGLQNMEDRVQALRGQFHIDRDRGFKLFISIPKEKTDL